jgi:NhaP-type Na+/H+ or K+/H+ antiporter
MAIVAFDSTALTGAWSHSWNVAFILIVLMLCYTARAIGVFPLSYVINKFRNERKITFAEQIVVWFSGLRGVIAFALALEMTRTGSHVDANGDEIDGTPNAPLFVSTTLVIVIVTTFVNGGLIETLLGCR